MKGITVILALIVLVLSVMPCCFDCDSESEVVKTEQTANTDCADICSPFYNCSSCVGLAMVNTPIPALSPFTQSALHFTVYKQPAFSFSQHPIWQPPKVS